MKVEIGSGKYVVAVSGGVDSMVLLDLLWKQRQVDSNLKLIIAHLDHGMRNDSREDRVLVENVAKKYSLPFVYEEAKLGSKASESMARKARYEFLEKVKKENNANAIITAHHQDDVLETAIINMLRGSGRKGLTSLSSSKDIVRPLLSTPKQELINYAENKKLAWREDSTNQDTNYLRNYVRHNLLPEFTDKNKTELLANINDLRDINEQLDNQLISDIKNNSETDGIERYWFNSLPHEVAREVLTSWLRDNGVRDFDRKLIERLVVAAKVSEPGKQLDVKKNVTMLVSKKDLNLTTVNR